MSDAVTDWLEALGLGQYAGTFKENAIDWDLLPDVDQDTLKDIGIKAAGHRLRILKAVTSFRAEQGGEAPAAIEPDKTSPANPRSSDQDLAAWERQPGERKPVTMLFADIVGSTALTEFLDAEEAHELLYGATQRMCEAVEDHRGTVCRFMGDGAMAMFGAPIASEHHAVDACEAAVAMQQAIRKYARQLSNDDHCELSIRVGLHSGEVVVLTVGDGEKVEYDASGPVVAIAARMEQAAKPGDIYLTAATQSLAGSRIESQVQTPVQVKGVTDPLPVFVLRRMRSLEEAATAAARTQFVGRRAELNQFRGLLETCLEEEQGQSVYVRGEAGIGKTRLVSEFARIAAESGASVHRSLVLPFGVGKGQDAIRSLVRSLLGVPPGGGKEDRQRAIESAIESRWFESEQLVFLNDLLDLPQTTEQTGLYDAMDNRARNDGKQAVVSALLSVASNSGPVLTVVEDVHWADEISLAQLVTLAKTVSECNALLVMTSRIDGDQLGRQWLARIEGSPLTTIDLGPLRKQDSITLIGEFIDAMGPVAEQCLERAAGNPLFLEQLLRTAQESSSAELPDSIQSLVLARIDRLEVEDKRALQAASVIGQRFDMKVVQHLLQRKEYDGRILIEHNLVRPEGEGYLFGHALVQEAVYSSLLRRQRLELHQAAAEWFAQRDNTLYAQHLDMADDKRAGSAYLEAAREQTRQYRYEIARRLILRGLEVAAPGAERHELICFKAELLLDLGDVEASMAAYREAEEHAENELALLEAWIGIAACMRLTTDYQGALTQLEKCDPVAEKCHCAILLSRLHHLRGNIYFPLGNVDGCRKAHQAALEYAREAGSAEAEARALGGLGDAEFAHARMKSAYSALRLCVEQCRKHGFGRIEVANLSQMTDALFFLGDCSRALGDSLDAARAAARVSHDRAEMNARAGVCGAAFEFGDVDELETSARRGQALAQKLQARSWEPLWLANLVLAAYLRREPVETRDLIEAGKREGARAFVGGWVLGTLALTTNDPETRIQALNSGDSLRDEGSMGEGILWYYRLAMEACLESRDWRRATAYADALEDFTRSERLPWSTFFVARGRVLAAAGQANYSASIKDELERVLAEAHRWHLSTAIGALKTTRNSI